MPNASAVKVTARVQQVGIAGLDSRTGEDGGALQGSASRIIGTNPRYSSSTYIPTHMLFQNEGRLAKELRDLWRAGSISITIDGQAISSISELTLLGEPVSLYRRGEVFIGPLEGYYTDVGAWTEAYASGVFTVTHTPFKSPPNRTLVVPIPANYLTGSADAPRKPRGIRLYYKTETAVIDGLGVDVFQLTPPATGTAVSASSIATNGTYDSDHDTALKRNAVGDHTLEFTFADTDVDWLESGDGLLIEITLVGSATGVFIYKGASFLYWERSGPALLPSSEQ